MKKIVALKDKERADEIFHKERTPESETDLSEAQNEKFLDGLAKKERQNFCGLKAPLIHIGSQ